MKTLQTLKQELNKTYRTVNSKNVRNLGKKKRAQKIRSCTSKLITRIVDSKIKADESNK